MLKNVTKSFLFETPKSQVYALFYINCVLLLIQFLSSSGVDVRFQSKVTQVLATGVRHILARLRLTQPVRTLAQRTLLQDRYPVRRLALRTVRLGGVLWQRDLCQLSVRRTDASQAKLRTLGLGQPSVPNQLLPFFKAI